MSRLHGTAPRSPPTSSARSNFRLDCLRTVVVARVQPPPTNLKSVRDQERAVAEQAERTYQRLFSRWKQAGPRVLTRQQ
jgi:hypothetical protein